MAAVQLLVYLKLFTLASIAPQANTPLQMLFLL
jgi:hypothetical protein